MYYGISYVDHMLHQQFASIFLCLLSADSSSYIYKKFLNHFATIFLNLCKDIIVSTMWPRYPAHCSLLLFCLWTVFEYFIRSHISSFFLIFHVPLSTTSHYIFLIILHFYVGRHLQFEVLLKACKHLDPKTVVSLNLL